jgi:hypothetical protein
MWSGEYRHLGSGWLSELYGRFGITEAESVGFGWVQDARNGDLICPIWSEGKVRVGTETRQSGLSYDDSRPKTRNYFSEDVPHQAWYLRVSMQGSKVPPLVLVEDSISAIKVSRQFPCISLLGSHITLERLEPCLETGRYIVIALDPDATMKAFKFQKQFGLLGDIRVAVLDRDFKYESDERIKELVYAAG